ncbi:hypothetical protein BCR36DRAFT_587216 [Piromyces finnis]|uniref:DM13 domain-containing protein n=1 Tax=Piromyces finnis TaxID=1754191 RepID=A0A1Y1UWA6_9FUNG|nr:hypothetical protein BCR36DRAFT_587216 [Piromyces finnis]|eukprot:ORX42396.1 hypothetical protein BCR36DRAFT_587216 [Piromyces finnis]
MKFSTLFTTLSTVASVALASYCGTQCDPNKIPDTSLSGPIQLVAVNDNKDSSIHYQVAGTVVIENDCVFTVKGFKLTPKSDGAKWYGASDPNSNEGILLSEQEVGVTSTATDLSYNIKDTSLFCHASLIKDVGNGGILRLMDRNSQLLAYAKISAGAASSPAKPSGDAQKTTTKKDASETKPASTQTSEATKPGNATEPATEAANPSAGTSTTTAAPAASSTNNSKPITNVSQTTSGSLSNYKVPSVALYAALLVLAFLKF